MQGLGNDFVVFMNQPEAGLLGSESIKALCDRRQGVGCDQLIIVTSTATSGVWNMLVHNADGTRASACGNASRCLVKLIASKEFGIDQACGKSIVLQTDNRKIIGRVEADGMVSINMGAPWFSPGQIPIDETYELHNQQLEVVSGWPAMYVLSVGNPHAVCFVSDADVRSGSHLQSLGVQVQAHPAFVEGVNFSLAAVLPEDVILLSVFERGAGPTKGCGTAACATFVAARSAGLVSSRARVVQVGGTLELSVAPDAGRSQHSDVWMKGPAHLVFEGKVDVSTILASAPDESCVLKLSEKGGLFS